MLLKYICAAASTLSIKDQDFCAAASASKDAQSGQSLQSGACGPSWLERMSAEADSCPETFSICAGGARTVSLLVSARTCLIQSSLGWRGSICVDKQKNLS
jgi:hypothetical protein